MQQQPSQTTPQTVSGQGVFTIPVADIPRTGDELRALRSRTSQLREQLQDAAERRASVAGRLREADEAARQGYIDRLKILDARILSLETEISNSVARMAAAPVVAHNAVAEQRQQTDPALLVRNVIDDLIPIVAIVSVFVLGPIAFAISRFIWKRSTAPAIKAGPDRVTQDRLEQLQQSMDSIAIEVERISEGQRFVTKIMSDRQIGTGAAEPVGVPKRNALGQDRG